MMMMMIYCDGLCTILGRREEKVRKSSRGTGKEVGRNGPDCAGNVEAKGTYIQWYDDDDDDDQGDSICDVCMYVWYVWCVAQEKERLENERRKDFRRQIQQRNLGERDSVTIRLDEPSKFPSTYIHTYLHIPLSSSLWWCAWGYNAGLIFSSFPMIVLAVFYSFSQRRNGHGRRWWYGRTDRTKGTST